LNRTLSREGFWLLLTLAIFWGVNWPAMKFAVLELPPWVFRVACVYIGAAGLFAIAWRLRLDCRVPPGRLRQLAIAGFLNVTIWHVSTAYGLQHVEAGRAALIAFTMPMWVSLFGALFLGEAFDRRRAAALAFGGAGLLLLAWPAFAGLIDRPIGLALMLAAATGWASGTVYTKRANFRMPVVASTAWQLALGGVPLIAGLIWFDLSGHLWPAQGLTLQGWLGFGYAATVPMIYCHWAWFRALDIMPAPVAALGLLAVPVVGVASSAWLTGERFAALDCAAMAAIMVALFLALRPPKTISAG
jgi:drug/metabolite transporter (DMT)-like permease